MLVQKRLESGYLIITLEDCLRADRTIQRLRGRHRASLSPNDKDALIGALSTLVVASGQGMRPSANVSSWLTDVQLQYAIEIGGVSAGW